jgi:hypothetical protein
MVKGILGSVGGAPTDSNMLFGFGIAAVSVSGSPVTRRGAGSMGVWCPARLLSVGITAQVAVRVLIEDCKLSIESAVTTASDSTSDLCTEKRQLL